MGIITLTHGSGGKSTHELINRIFYKHFNNELLLQQGDSSIIDNLPGKVAITTDSYIVSPIFFPGGDIGKLSICGTVNDLVVSGAKPLYIAAGFIMEEGLEISVLEKVVRSMSETAKSCEVKIVAGDTKVVEKGKGDKLYINTTGIGIFEKGYELSAAGIKAGDKIIVSGTLGEHGITILSQREEINFETEIKSDCCSLQWLIKDILAVSNNIKFIRDITRGGLATTLNEVILEKKQSIIIEEKAIPVRDDVKFLCEILGLDPLYIANEGKVMVIVSKEDAVKVLATMRRNPQGRNAEIIGEVVNDHKGMVFLKTYINGTRIIGMAEGELIPRIC